MSLKVEISQRLGNFTLAASFTGTGRLTALFGASGSGKTSIVRAIAGLTRPDEGEISIDGRVLSNTASRIFLPSHRRQIGYVFQDARLFPHMTCRQNLLYGRWFTPKRERYGDVEQIVGLLGIGHLLDRHPAKLSGGERQRVAIGRALAASPKLLLMDEPLASLDENRKAEILPYIERLRDEAGIPIVYVSHSIAEVARLADQVVMMGDGKVLASGPTTEVMLRTDLLPASARDEAGAVLEMTLAAQDSDYAMSILKSDAGEIRVQALDMDMGAKVRLRIRARDVLLSLKRPEEISGLNVLEGEVIALTNAVEGQVDITIDCRGQRIVARVTRLSVDRLSIRTGLRLFAIIKSVSFERFEPVGAS